MMRNINDSFILNGQANMMQMGMKLERLGTHALGEECFENFFEPTAGFQSLVALEQPRGSFPAFRPNFGPKTVPDLRHLFVLAGSRM
jgi:hypothetical protein